MLRYKNVFKTRPTQCRMKLQKELLWKAKVNIGTGLSYPGHVEMLSRLL